MAFRNINGFTGEFLVKYRDPENQLQPYYHFDTPSGLPFLFRRRGRGVELLTDNFQSYTFDNTLGDDGLWILADESAGRGSLAGYEYRYFTADKYLGFRWILKRFPDDTSEELEFVNRYAAGLFLNMFFSNNNNNDYYVDFTGTKYIDLSTGTPKVDVYELGLTYDVMPSGEAYFAYMLIEEGEELFFQRLFGKEAEYFIAPTQNALTNNQKLVEVLRGRLDGQVMRFKTQEYRDNEEVPGDCQLIEFRNHGSYPCTIDDRYLAPGETFRLDTLSLNNSYKIGNVFRLKFSTESNIDLTRLSSQL